MNETDAVVVRVEGDCVWVRAHGPGHACGACAQKEGCHVAAVGVVDSTLGQPGTRLLLLPNSIGARAGDAVTVRACDGAVLHAVWLAYGVPLLLALVGAMAGLELTGSEPFAALGMLCGLIAGFAALRLRTLRVARREPILSIEFKKVF